MRVDGKLCVAISEARRVEGDVKFAVGADQLPHIGGRQRRGIVTERKPTRDCFGPDPCVKLRQRLRQASQVLVACIWRQIDVSCRWYRGLLCDSSEGADDDITHLVPVQRGDDGRRIQLWLTEVSLVTHATSSAGVAWRHA